VVVFDPLDGSSNIDAGISTGSIFGIYVRFLFSIHPSDACSGCGSVLPCMDCPFDAIQTGMRATA
jgi:hypothetical protein